MKPQEKVLAVDIGKCLGCHSCEIACALEHSQSQILAEAIREKNRAVPRVQVEMTEGVAMPLQCRQCEDAPCMEVCPTNALHRAAPLQPINIDESRCIGCKMCVMVCPFGVITLRGEGSKVAVKCDVCPGRTEEGRLPACVEACKTHALKFLALDEITKQKRRAAVEAAAKANVAANTDEN